MGHRIACRRGPFVAVAALTLLLGACTDPLTSPRTPDGTQSQSPGAIEHPGEAAFQEISKIVPSFAGYFLDGDELVVYVTDLAQAQAAEAAVLSVLDPHLVYSSIVARPAKFSFLQLSHWRDEIETGVFFGLSDAVGIDLDEGRNRIVLDLADGSGRAELEDWLARSTIPRDAVVIEVTGPVEVWP